MPDSADTPSLAAANRAITHFLSAVYQALDLPAPLRGKDQLPYLTLLDQRARLARAGIGRLISNPHAGALDYTSEGDHLRHVLADLPPDTYRHDPAEQLLPDVEFSAVSLGMHRLLAGGGQDDRWPSWPWLEIAGGLARFEGGEAEFRGWLFTLARRRVIDVRRYSRRHAVRLTGTPLTWTGPPQATPPPPRWRTCPSRPCWS